MEVGAGDRDEIQPVRPGAEATAPPGRDARTGDLQRGEAAVDQDPQRRFPEIIGGMGETGNPTRTPDQGDRLGPGEPRLGDLGGSAVAEVAGERLAEAGDLVRPHQPVGQVAAAERGAGKGLAECHQVDLQAQRGESVGHRAKPIGAGAAERVRRRPQRRVVVADEVAEDVDLASPVVHGSQLDPADQLHAQTGRFGPGDGDCGKGVVVGDRQRRQADATGRDHHLAGRADAVGMRGVDVQIGRTRPRRPAGGWGCSRWLRHAQVGSTSGLVA